MQASNALKLSIVWVCVRLIYLLGDVLRVYSGDFKAGQPGGGEIFNLTPGMWMQIAMLMDTPILIPFLSVTLNQPVNLAGLQDSHGR